MWFCPRFCGHAASTDWPSCLACIWAFVYMRLCVWMPALVLYNSTWWRSQSWRPYIDAAAAQMQSTWLHAHRTRWDDNRPKTEFPYMALSLSPVVRTWRQSTTNIPTHAHEPHIAKQMNATHCGGAAHRLAWHPETRLLPSGTVEENANNGNESWGGWVDGAKRRLAKSVDNMHRGSAQCERSLLSWSCK